MKNIIGITFKERGKVYFFDADSIEVNKGDNVIVETERGKQFGFVEVLGVDASKSKEDFKKVLKKATSKDEQAYKKNLEDATKVLKKADEIAKKQDLNMKFTEASYNLDRSLLVLCFLSDNRIDFRELVKELASIYKTRIELRQIGVRDKAKEVNGLGQCGRLLCCSSFLNDLDSVSISMAKDQNLALNPTKINGQCGRLLCCLKYEDETYNVMKKGMPILGKKIDTENGVGKVINVDILKRTYVVELEDKTRIEVKVPFKDDKNEK